MTYSPYEIVGADHDARILLTCDHASNYVPSFIAGGDLGLPEEDMQRHIAYDVGAAGVTRELSRLLQAPAILSHFSRLCIDPNRGEDDPTLLMKIYDHTIIPANRHADAEEVARRKAACYTPYHTALAELAARREDTVIVAVHSFTRKLRSRHPRPWQIGILHVDGEAYSESLIDILRREGDLTVGDNEPYAGHLPGDAVDRHGLQMGRPNTLIELRQDLIEADEDQIAWARRLAPMLEQALEEAKI